MSGNPKLFLSRTGYREVESATVDTINGLISAGSGITITGSGTLSSPFVISAPGILQWSEVTGPTTATPNNGYVANNSSTVPITLPVLANFGDIIRIVGKGAGGWSLLQNAGQAIHFGDDTTTVGVGGSVASQNSFDCIELVCTTANTNFTALSSIGNMTIT